MRAAFLRVLCRRGQPMIAFSVAEGRMTASGFQSKFSLNAQRIAIAGEGALMALL